MAARVQQGKEQLARSREEGGAGPGDRREETATDGTHASADVDLLSPEVRPNGPRRRRC